MAATEQTTLDQIEVQSTDQTTTPREPEVATETHTVAPVKTGGVFFELVDGEYVEREIEAVIKKKGNESGFFGAKFSRGDETVTVDTDQLRTALSDGGCGTWVGAMYAGETDDGEPQWIPHPKQTHGRDGGHDLMLRSAPNSPSDLSFERISGTGSKKEINTFLDGRDDGFVFHHLGGVHAWKKAFVARYNGEIVSAIVLFHYHPSTNGTEIAITRLANHEVAPKNTSTWMIGRARRWAERAGYERIASYADLDLNEGTVYHAAGFDPVGEPEEVEGKDWSGDDSEWTRQKYVAHLNPQKYAGKSEEWATETVETRGVA